MRLMKRLMRRLMQPVVYAICAVNVAYVPLSVSAMGQVIVGPPQVGTPIPLITGSDVLAAQEETFEALFGVPYDPNSWTYPLDTVITGNGAYTGQNELGQPFDFNVVASVNVPISSLTDLSPTQQQFLIDNNFAFTSVIAQMSTDLTTVGVTGLAISQANAVVPFDSRFVLSYTIDNDNPIFWPDTVPLTGSPDGGGGSESAGISTPIFIPIFCPDARCVDDCNDAYDDAVEDATDAFDAAVEAADATFDAAVSTAAATQASAHATAQSTYSAAVAPHYAEYESTKTSQALILAGKLTAATLTLTAVNAACLISTGWTWWTGGLATLACALLAHAGYASTVHSAVSAYESKMQIAETTLAAAIAPHMATYAAAVAAADAAYDSAVADAETARNDAYEDAQTALDEALAAAAEDLEDCLDDCPYVICGWIIFWIPF